MRSCYAWIFHELKKNMSMGKTYSIRKVEGGGGVGGQAELWKKKKWVLVSFPHSATPLVKMLHKTVQKTVKLLWR